MKKQIARIGLASLITSSFFASQAQASYVQTYCSTADNSLSRAIGHSELYFYATKLMRTNQGMIEERVPLEDVEVEQSQEVILVDESSDSCRPGDQVGVSTWHTVTYAKVHVTNHDGSLFSEDIVGVTSDRTGIEATWICDTYGNAQILCPASE